MKALDRILQRWRIRKATPYIRTGDRLLDIGCHDGVLIGEVLDRVASATGIDTDITPGDDGKVRLLRGEFPGDFNFEDHAFDCITLLAVLEHVRQPERLASESAEEHHGFDVAQTIPIFERAGLALRAHRRFQLGLNHLFVFEKSPAQQEESR